MSAADTLAEWALYFAALGWPVFPLRPGTKIPTGHAHARCPGTGRCARGHVTPEQRATTNPELITEAWSQTPWNIAIATGPAGLLVVDLDLPKDTETGPDGHTALHTLATERGAPVPATYTVSTPSGGQHLYYRAPAGTHLRSTSGHIADRVDTRGWGGYVVAPGSILPEGGYELYDDHDHKPAELPGWLIQANEHRPPATSAAPTTIRTEPSRWAHAALRNESDRVRQAPREHHNNVLSTAAYAIGRKVGAGLLDHTTARAALIDAAHHMTTADCRCTTHEITRVVDAGLTAGSTKPANLTTEAA
ncbi:bifunctional DNA primase/polymerase-like protein [Tamaricihabitans halophyticus]|uniref:Bifunctional DNA primase/polymerase-like protein n=1 Tax=Tamaricihabitans halophyticus TaxID=1262583 RepID=A0A4R2R2J7_9PSEU|nr:bifunctional DNA primase/polymerase [Tamaricihabitans halophyticus]TCP56970.1 bifunctional DNA primase/polymerase-like protein [Tamaricihabitans halophyticus]